MKYSYICKGLIYDYVYNPKGKPDSETVSDLRDTENVPVKAGIYNSFICQVKPHLANARTNLYATKIGYEISF